MKTCIVIIVAIIIFPSCTTATPPRRLYEKDYQLPWCKKAGGIPEYIIKSERTRVDCLTDEYAIEFDYAPKFYSAIGQSLYYSAKTGKKAGIVLILKSKKDKKYLNRLKTTINVKKLPIKVWILPASLDEM